MELDEQVKEWAVRRMAEGEGYEREIMDLFVRQKAKGLEKYGQTLDQNELSVQERLEHLEEELMDALVYIQHIKAGLYGGAEG